MSATVHPQLEEIRGPSAVGGGGRRFLDLLWLISRTEFKLGYHGTVLGFAWSLMRPLLLFGILLVVFTQVFRFGDSVENYAAMLLLNIMLFGLFQESTEAAVRSVVSNEQVVRKMQFPRLVIPLSIVLTRTLQFGLNMIIVFTIILATGVDPIWTWALFPVVVLSIVLLTTCLSMLLSALYVRVRDIAIIWNVIALMLFYATPVLYPIDFPTNETVRDAILINPLTPIFTQAREWIIDPNAPGAVESVAGNQLLLIIPALTYLTVCVVGVWYFFREAPRIAEEL